MIYDPRVRRAEGIAEKIVMKYMGQESSRDTITAIQKEYSEALKEAGIPEGLVCIHLDQGNGSVYIHQPAPAFRGNNAVVAGGGADYVN